MNRTTTKQINALIADGYRYSDGGLVYRNAKQVLADKYDHDNDGRFFRVWPSRDDTGNGYLIYVPDDLENNEISIREIDVKTGEVID